MLLQFPTLYNTEDYMPLYVRDSEEALIYYNKFRCHLTSQQQERLLSSTIGLDQNEYWISSGPDLVRDHSGFGKTIFDAMQDYVRIYLKKAC